MAGFWENHKIKKDLKKEQKRVKSDVKTAETLAQANDEMVDLAAQRREAALKKKAEEDFKKMQDKNRLSEQIHEARSNLFVQRKKLLGRLIHFNREYKYIEANQPNTRKKEAELRRCSAGAKNAAYALAVVEDAISRLDDIPSEYEWREIMRDLTKGYKMVNAVSVGSDLMTRLAFLWQKAKYDLKDDLTVEAMEHYYGRSIDTLLEEQQIDKEASEYLVKDDVLSMGNEQEIADAIRWGTIFNVQPSEMAEAAEQQSREARRNRSAAIYDDPDETFDKPADLNAALDSLPSMM